MVQGNLTVDKSVTCPECLAVFSGMQDLVVERLREVGNWSLGA